MGFKVKEVPYFNYAAVCWSGATKGTLNPLRKLQKRIVRMIGNKKFNSHTEPIFKRLRILPLEHQKHYADAVTGYKVWHKLAPHSKLFESIIDMLPVIGWFLAVHLLTN